MLIDLSTPVLFTIAAGLGLSRSPGDYAPVLLLICVGVLFFFGHRFLSRRQ